MLPGQLPCNACAVPAIALLFWVLWSVLAPWLGTKALGHSHWFPAEPFFVLWMDLGRELQPGSLSCHFLSLMYHLHNLMRSLETCTSVLTVLLLRCWKKKKKAGCALWHLNSSQRFACDPLGERRGSQPGISPRLCAAATVPTPRSGVCGLFSVF